uniref:U-box domain-containing protein n=1 Tax=Florenciella parvula TaxID=236787 RepID=A0A7S2FUT8_9STRA|mmetsp:Transcript_24671/g.50936  ORF Transcript_24671/g.50936 Transcript_24671/m.50936 type:complete len:575 (+) Transcript_24671:199-1923(+)
MAQLVIDVPSPDKAPPALDPSTGLTPSFGAVAVNADAAALPSLDLGEAAASRPGGASPKGSMAAPPPRKSPRPEPDVANGKAVPPQKKPRLSFDSNEDVSGDNAEQAAAAAAAEVAAVAAEDAKGALNSARMLESTKDVAASVASVASAGTMAGTVAGIEEEKSSDAPPGQLSTSVAERDGWDVVVDEDAWQAKGAGEGEGEGQGQGQGDDKGQGAPPVEPTDAHMPVGLPGTQDAINLDTYDADADVEEEEAAAAAAGASASNAGDMGFEGSEGSDEDNLEPGDDGLPWVLPDASCFQDTSQGGATAGSDEGAEGAEGAEGPMLPLKIQAGPVEVPPDMICPITREIMHDPVIALDGFSYEREAIAQWFSASLCQGEGHLKSPLTNETLDAHTVTPNHTLRKVIENFVSENPDLKLDLEDPDAFRTLGVMYFDGKGVTPSWRRARGYYKRAIELGNSQAVRPFLRADGLKTMQDLTDCIQRVAPLMDKRVEIHGTSRADMNGKRGVATDFHMIGGPHEPATWRYTVKLDGGEAFKVKPANLRLRAVGTGASGGGGSDKGKGKGKGKKGRAGRK